MGADSLATGPDVEQAPGMLNVIFRQRARMAAVYGRVAPGELAGERFASAPSVPSKEPRRHGQVGRKGRSTVALPMPRRTRPKAD